MSDFETETLQIANERAEELSVQFQGEVKRLLESGAVDPEHHSRGLLFGVALENLADNFLRGERRNNPDYRNLKQF